MYVINFTIFVCGISEECVSASTNKKRGSHPEPGLFDGGMARTSQNRRGMANPTIIILLTIKVEKADSVESSV